MTATYRATVKPNKPVERAGSAGRSPATLGRRADNMKHLKSSLQDLRMIFDRALTVRHVAEPFLTFDSQRSAREIADFMKGRDFDVVGVRRLGLVVGYVNRSELTGDTLEEHVTPFEPHLQVDEVLPIPDVLRLLRDSPRVFVVVMGYVSGIVTKGDLQKAPVTMYLFGTLSLLEMQLLRLIRTAFPEDSWKEHLSPKRIDNAIRLLTDRHRRNEATDLADCLQFADKATIVAKCRELREALGFRSARDAEALLSKLQRLRDALAHAQDIVTGRWPELVNLLESAEQVLQRAEASGLERAAILARTVPIDQRQ